MPRSTETDRKPQGTEPPADLPKAETPSFDWSALAVPVAAPAKKAAGTGNVGAKTDVLTDTHEMIRQRAEEALTITCQRRAEAVAKGTKVENVDPAWQTQPVASEKMGQEFKRLLVRYCKYRPAATAEKPIPFRGETRIGEGESITVTPTPEGQLTPRVGDPTFFVLIDGKAVAFKDDQSDEIKATKFLGVRYVVTPFQARKDTKAVGSATGNGSEKTPDAA